jgi:uncharacterized protein (DUF111 family)
MLKREEKKVETKYGVVRIKECFLNGSSLRYKPEFEDCKTLAKKYNVSLSVIEKAVINTLENGY